MATAPRPSATTPRSAPARSNTGVAPTADAGSTRGSRPDQGARPRSAPTAPIAAATRPARVEERSIGGVSHGATPRRGDPAARRSRPAGRCTASGRRAGESARSGGPHPWSGRSSTGRAAARSRSSRRTGTVTASSSGSTVAGRGRGRGAVVARWSGTAPSGTPTDDVGGGAAGPAGAGAVGGSGRNPDPGPSGRSSPGPASRGPGTIVKPLDGGASGARWRPPRRGAGTPVAGPSSWPAARWRGPRLPGDPGVDGEDDVDVVMRSPEQTYVHRRVRGRDHCVPDPGSGVTRSTRTAQQLRPMGSVHAERVSDPLGKLGA